MSGRDAILGAIRRALPHSRDQLERWASSAPHMPPPFVHPAAGDLIGQLATELERLDAHVYRCESGEAARDHVRKILVQAQASTIIAWNESAIGLPDLDRLLESIGVAPVDARPARGAAARASAIDEQAAATVGITGVDAAVAESGTLVLAGGAGRGRLASLLAPVHVAIVRESQVVRGLGEALLRLRTLYGDSMLADRSNVTFITGPSRTADIELTLTLGVHGPREVHVLIVRDPPGTTDRPASAF